MKVTACETAMKTRYTADTLSQIVSVNRHVRFVWIMGADNLGQFHRWERWRDIAALMPFAVFDRPGSTLELHSAQAAHALSHFRLGEQYAPCLADSATPRWTFIHGPRNSLSSTLLRAAKRD